MEIYQKMTADQTPTPTPNLGRLHQAAKKENRAEVACLVSIVFLGEILVDLDV